MNPLFNNTTFYDINGKKVNYTPASGSFYSKNGKTKYTFSKGKLVQVSTTKSSMSKVNPKFAQYTKSSTLLDTTVSTGGKEYNVYKTGNKYYYYVNGKAVEIKNKISAIAQNKKMTIDLDPKPTANTNQPAPQTNTNNNTNINTNTGGGGNNYTPSVDPGLYDLIKDIRAENKELKNKIEELSKPKYYTANQLAEMHGVQDLYNEQKWLNDYNTATNKYYDEAVATQQDLRNSYAINNGQYLDKTLESYMDSYANQTPTATAKGATAANALSTILKAGQTYANDDYNMLQTENLLEEQRKAELANNPNVAKQQYNNIGLMLSQLGTDYYSSAVKEYVNQLDAYGSMYAGNRAAEGLANQGTAAKYNGLLTAAQNRANASSYNSDWSQLYNYYYNTRNKNSYAADSAIAKLLNSSMNRAQ